jgi:hypothetical protein
MCDFTILEKVDEEFFMYKVPPKFLLFDLITVSILYLFFKIIDKYFKSSLETWNFVVNLAFLPNPGCPSLRNQITNANGVRKLSKLRGIIFMLSL